VTAHPRQTRKKNSVTTSTVTKPTARSKSATKGAAAGTKTKAKDVEKRSTKRTDKASRGTTATKTRDRKSGEQPTRPVGHVSFVGAGPGDASLLTVRAADLLARADVVITELPEQAALAPDGAEIIEGGSNDEGAALTPSVRGRIVVRHAKSGRNVVRLLAGDPFTYATGPEEALACSKAGISFEIVPGLSPVTAVPAYAGVPLTTRTKREVSVVRVGDSRINWEQYAGDQTLVLLSAADSLTSVADALVEAGRDPSTPIAITATGTTTAQTTIVSTLDSVAADTRKQTISPSAVTVVGDTVDLRETLSWFETKPLFGWRVLVPRTKEQAESLSQRLHAYGAVSEGVPTISVEPPRNPQQMDKAIRGLVEGRYEWIVFTSVNAVKAVREKFEEYGLDARAFSGLKIAAVGDKTAASIEEWGIKPDRIPTGEQSARGLLEDWPPYDDVLDPINRVFLPRADIATEQLVAGLIELGWEVDDVTAYRTVRAAPPPAPTREAIKTGKFDAVVFTSSSTVRNLVGIAGKPHTSTIIACIGPATAKTAEEHGLRVDVQAEKPSVEVLADALADFGAARRQAMIEAGDPVTKPSQRKGSSRRRSR